MLRFRSRSRSRSSVIAQTLYRHFFRRFFDNDTLSPQGDTEKTIARALCFCAVPGLMVAFWLLPCYPNRPEWAIVADRYFFVLYSFVTMGIVTTFEWEMLFPDRADFLILLPLPLKSRQLFITKAKALIAFLALFLVSSNIFALVFFSAVSTGRFSSYFHTVAAHSAAVLCAGLFAAGCMLAIEGLCITLLPDAWQRWISAILQALVVTLLLLLFLLFPLFGAHMQTLLEGHASFTRFIPPLWFLGLYEQLAAGKAAPAGAQPLATLGLYATAVSFVLALATYPLAWVRQKKRALEGASRSRRPAGTSLAHLLHHTLLRRPQERAIFHFTSQTIRRNQHYQVYLAIYSGVGLSLALASVLTLQRSTQHLLTLAISPRGLHAVLPLLLFWLAVGLRVAFGFPIDMRARWVFPMNMLRASGSGRATASWVLICCWLLTAAMLCVLFALGWGAGQLLQQAVWGTALSLLLADVLFSESSRIPFTYPRLPGRATLPMTLVLYAAAFPVFVLLTVSLELAAEAQPSILARVLLGIAAVHILLKVKARYMQPDTPTNFSNEESDDEFLTLGLTS